MSRVLTATQKAEDSYTRVRAGKGVDVSGVQRVAAPTRDVLVVFDKDGDRKFVGFGKTVTTKFADCFIDPEKLPVEVLQVTQMLRISPWPRL